MERYIAEKNELLMCAALWAAFTENMLHERSQKKKRLPIVRLCLGEVQEEAQ